MPEYGCMPIERISIKRMRVLGAFPAFLDDLNLKFYRVSPDLPSMLMLYHSVHSKERLQTRLQTNCPSIHSCITSPYWWESKSVSKGCGKWENREVRIDLAKNIMAKPLKVRCKTPCRPHAAACNGTILVCAKSFFKKGSCMHLPFSAYWPVDSDVTEGVITTRSNRMKFKIVNVLWNLLKGLYYCCSKAI